MWILVFISAVVAYFLYNTCIKPLSHWKKKGIVYEKAWPLFGNLGSSMLRQKHIVDVQLDLYNKYPNSSYVGLHQFTRPILMIKDLDLIKKMLIKDFDHFVDHTGFVQEDPDPIMGKNLFIMKGNTWREMRATLSPAFTSSKIRNMSSFMFECAQNLQDNIPKDKGVVEYKPRDLFSKFANDVIASSAFGIKSDSIKDNGNNEFYQMAKKFTSFTGIQNLKIFFLNCFPQIYTIFKCTIFPQEQVNYFHKIVQDTMIKREAEKIVRPDLIHLLMEAKKGRLSHDQVVNEQDAGFATVTESDIGKSDKLKKIEWTDEEVTAQSLLFFFAGFDTASTASSFVAYELAVNADVQEKLQEEIDTVLEETGGKMTHDHIIRMKYLDQVIAETLRKWTPGFQTDRLCTKDYTIVTNKPDEKEIVIEAGTTVMFPIMAIHKNPDYYPDPDRFDPDRFSDENKNNIIPGTYMPFGAGPRNCIGSRFALLEVKILFFYLLAKFDIVPTKKTQIPHKLDPGKMNLTPEKMVLGFKPRIITNL